VRANLDTARSFVSALPRALWQAFRNFGEDEAGLRAAAMAYYALLSFFPFVLLLASVAALFVGDDPADVRAFFAPLRPFLPFLADGFWERVQDLVEHREVLSIASLALLLFLATRVTVATDRAIRAVFHARRDVEPSRHPVLDRLRAWLLTLFALITLGLLFVAINALEYVTQIERSSGWIQAVVERPWFARRIIPGLVAGGLAFMLYRRAPGIRIRTRWALAGAGLFAIGHDVGISLYATYTTRVARQDAFYGSYVGVVSLAIWVFLLSCLLLFGAELVAVLNGGRPSYAPAQTRT
jgi:membrane protein